MYSICCFDGFLMLISRRFQEYYRLIFSQKLLFAAHFSPDKTKTAIGKETPLCFATDNAICVNCGLFVLSGIACFDAHEEEAE